jgi:succinate dehydrogenase hydrophobic anchor subunit
MKNGHTHWKGVLKSGLLLFVLMPWFFMFFYQITHVSPCCVHKLLKSPLSLALASVFNGALFAYIYLMLEDVYEDYIHCPLSKRMADLSTYVVMIILWAVAQASLIKIGVSL